MQLFKKIHFLVGLLAVLHFIITGIIMRMNAFSIESGDTLVRMMFRANHLYILFSGLVNLLISYSHSKEKKLSAFHLIASGILLLATLGISLSFYIDPIHHLGSDLIQRKLSGYCLQGFLLGTVIHLVLLQFYHKKPDRNINSSL